MLLSLYVPDTCTGSRAKSLATHFNSTHPREQTNFVKLLSHMWNLFMKSLPEQMTSEEHQPAPIWKKQEGEIQGRRDILTCLLLTDRCNQHRIALWNFSPWKANLTGQRGCQYFLQCCDQMLPVLNFCKASAWWSECQFSQFHSGATGWRDLQELQPQALSNTYNTSSNGMKKGFAISQLWFINSSCCPWL